MPVLRLPFGIYIGWGGQTPRATIEQLRQQIQEQPDQAETHYELGRRLLWEIETNLRIRKKFKQEWTEAQVLEWYQRWEEGIREVQEAIRLYRIHPDFLSNPEMTQNCAVAHSMLAREMLRSKAPEQARIQLTYCLELATGEFASDVRKRLEALSQKLDKDKLTLLRPVEIDPDVFLGFAEPE